MFSLMGQQKNNLVEEVASPLPSSSPPVPIPSSDDARPPSPPVETVDDPSSSTAMEDASDNVQPAEEPNSLRRTTRRTSAARLSEIPSAPKGPSVLKRSDTIIIEPSTSTTAAATAALFAPAMNATALRNLTTKHTHKNQVYFNVLDRRVELRSGNRPPSPSSKIRTVAQREKDEAEKAREERANRRSIIKGDDSLSGSPERPLKHPRAPGDDDEYSTPKRVRLAMGDAEEDPVARRLFVQGKVRKGKDVDRSSSATPSVGVGSDEGQPPPKKNVRWDKLLTSEAGEDDVPTTGSASSRSGSGSDGMKSCLRKAVVSAFLLVTLSPDLKSVFGLDPTAR